MKIRQAHYGSPEGDLSGNGFRCLSHRITYDQSPEITSTA